MIFDLNYFDFHTAYTCTHFVAFIHRFILFTHVKDNCKLYAVTLACYLLPCGGGWGLTCRQGQHCAVVVGKPGFPSALFCLVNQLSEDGPPTGSDPYRKGWERWPIHGNRSQLDGVSSAQCLAG